GTPTEELLAETWSGLLSVERVGIHDNFFELGGHSLLAMRMIARVEKATGVHINPRDLMFQSLGQLASACDAQIRHASRQKSSVRKGGLLSKIRSAVGGKNPPPH
ncbi:MAG TPA: phosphopantetheine-binding protein, partial [Dehalococcoidia bacterium]|nr:phosphopantetheine-binding protein [Dehalococcoidia bacterium]